MDVSYTPPLPLARPRLKQRSGVLWREVLDTVVFIIAVYALVELAAPRFMVQGRSMQPTFYEEQRLIVSRVNYLFGDPMRGDIVVFNAPDARPNDPPLIKRLIGMPGETVEFIDQQLYINGQPLDEPYLREPCTEFRCRDNVWELGPDEYFMLGDNRNNSRDSRAFGVVPYDHLIGEALFRYWPPGDWGIVLDLGYPHE